jgi:hypothetical protein
VIGVFPVLKSKPGAQSLVAAEDGPLAYRREKSMAFYGDEKKVIKSTKLTQYQTELKPGESPLGPGIYKCQACGFEDVMNRACNTLPPCSNCNKKPHTWKFLVKAVDASPPPTPAKKS